MGNFMATLYINDYTKEKVLFSIQSFSLGKEVGPSYLQVPLALHISLGMSEMAIVPANAMPSIAYNFITEIPNA